MTTFRHERTYPVDRSRLFRAFADHSLAAEIVPEVTRVEFLPGPTSGAGARFIEHRRQGRKVVPMAFEVLECVENESIRVLSEAGGAEWDSCMRFSGDDGKATVEIQMEARAQSFMPRLMIPIFKPLIGRGLGKHLDAVGEWLARTGG